MKSVLHNHCDWLMSLFAVQQFGKTHLDPKNNRVALFTEGKYTCVSWEKKGLDTQKWKKDEVLCLEEETI